MALLPRATGGSEKAAVTKPGGIVYTLLGLSWLLLLSAGALYDTLLGFS